MDTKKKTKEPGKVDAEFGGAYPRYSGAISEVTGGPPEDINEMPPGIKPKPEDRVPQKAAV